ncbi:hypothetical protein OAF35_05465 [Verrucomicrobiales bacterium]|nr:hypothetical protein [Verrucomicrobiales bacterium]
MRIALLTLILPFVAMCLLNGQEKFSSRPQDKGQSEHVQIDKVPLGVKEAKPKVPTVEELLEKSKNGEVDADSMWVIIEHAKDRGVTAVDIRSDGSCWIMEKKLLGPGKSSPYIIRSSNEIPNGLSEKILGIAKQKSILFAESVGRAVAVAGGERVKIGVSANNGRSVHSSPTVPFSQYPEEFRESVALLMEVSRRFPLNRNGLGVISSEFVNPRQARRLTVISGQKLIAVKDPGRDAKELSAIVAASRMPGRRIVVTDPTEWLRIITYLNFDRPGSEAQEGQCLISVGAQTYRILVERASR